MLLLRRQSAATYAWFYFQKSNYNSKLIARAQNTIFQFFSTNLSQQNCRQFQKKLLHHIQKLRDHNKKLGQNEFCTSSSKKRTISYHICPILHANVQAVLGRGVAFLKPVLSQ